MSIYELAQSEPEFSRTNTDIFGLPEIAWTTIMECSIKPEYHIGVLKNFASAILEGKPLIADGREGINSLTISNAMHFSAWLNREVSIPLDDELYYIELMKRVAVSKIKESKFGEVSRVWKSH